MSLCGTKKTLLLVSILLLTAPDLHGEYDIKRMVFPDGSRYIGQITDGLRHGKGRFVWPDGSEYRGGFYRGLPDGEGVHWFSDGRRREVVYERGRLVRARFISNAQRRGDLARSPRRWALEMKRARTRRPRSYTTSLRRPSENQWTPSPSGNPL